jgi:ribosome-associated toxin RatA of RatAB toxin-antitoxin module
MLFSKWYFSPLKASELPVLIFLRFSFFLLFQGRLVSLLIAAFFADLELNLDRN